MKRIIVLLVMAMLAGLFFSYGLAASEPKIVVVGDSLTMQLGGSLSPGIINRGVSGAAANSIKNTVVSGLPEDADLISIMIGINNLYGFGEMPEETAGDIRELLTAVKQKVPGAIICLVSVLPTTIGSILNTKVVELNQLLVGVAEDAGVIFIDIHGQFAEPDGLTAKTLYIKEKNVHLTKTGQEFLADLLESRFDELLGSNATGAAIPAGEAGQFDPSVFLGDWTGSFSGGKILTPDGKKTAFSKKLYYNFSGPIHDWGVVYSEIRTFVEIDGVLFSDAAQQDKLHDAVMRVIEGSDGKIRIQIFSLFDEQNDCGYQIKGFFLPAAGRKKERTEVLLGGSCGEVLDFFQLFDNQYSAAGTLIKYKKP